MNDRALGFAVVIFGIISLFVGGYFVFHYDIVAMIKAVITMTAIVAILLIITGGVLMIWKSYDKGDK